MTARMMAVLASHQLTPVAWSSTPWRGIVIRYDETRRNLLAARYLAPLIVLLNRRHTVSAIGR